MKKNSLKLGIVFVLIMSLTFLSCGKKNICEQIGINQNTCDQITEILKQEVENLEQSLLTLIFEKYTDERDVSNKVRIEIEIEQSCKENNEDEISILTCRIEKLNKEIEKYKTE